MVSLLGIAPKEPEGVTVDEIGRGSSQANHAGIEVLDDFGEPLEERSVGFIENDEVEETRVELGITKRQRLLGSHKETFSFVNLMRVDPVARLVRQVSLKAIRQGLIDECVMVGEEENVLRLMRAEKHIDQGHGDARLASPGSHNEESPTLVAGESFGEAANGLVLVGAVNN
jgi:hypothetical protein